MTGNANPDLAPSPNLVRAQLEKILASDAFARCPRMQRFLAFVVEETLAGRADQIGEYGIGLAVFDRRPDFQPQLDPIVRNDARRLRQKLLEYYREAQPQDLTIEIPKGGYVPVFLPATAPVREQLSPPHGSPRVAVLPFEILSSGPELAILGAALGLSLTASLTDIEGLEIVAHGYVRKTQVYEAATGIRLTHVIDGVLLQGGDLCRAMISLIQVSAGTQLWAGEYEVDLTDVLATQNGIVACTIREVLPRLRGLPSAVRRLALVA